MSRATDRGSRRLKLHTRSKNYFAALGARVATLRKSQGYTQAELARSIGVSQQAVFAYELGDRRISVFILDELSKVLRTSIEDLMRTTKPIRERNHRLSPRAMRHAERLQGLSKTHQRFVIKIIDSLEEKTAVEKRYEPATLRSPA